jgi:hypothetical protein
MKQLFNAVIDLDGANELKWSARRRVLARACLLESTFPRLLSSHVPPLTPKSRPFTHHRPRDTISASHSISKLPERPALSSKDSFRMSTGDIDDELFALAGGDEEVDIEEGEA